VDTLELCLAAATGMVAGARFDRERMAAAASDELIAATDLADLLVRRGTPFREAHGIVAGLVREAESTGGSLRDVAVQALGEDAGEVLARSSWLESKVSEGGTASARVREQLELARAALA
ncbi:MAG TPA: argininosuccinate lyase, partial [Solirubrobacteraceae bacterium]